MPPAVSIQQNMTTNRFHNFQKKNKNFCCITTLSNILLIATKKKLTLIHKAKWEEPTFLLVSTRSIRNKPACMHATTLLLLLAKNLLPMTFRFSVIAWYVTRTVREHLNYFVKLKQQVNVVLFKKINKQLFTVTLISEDYTHIDTLQISEVVERGVTFEASSA